MRLIGFALLLLFASSVGALAETSYVTDQLVLTLRSAPAESAEVVGHLRTADAVEVLAEEGGYLQVRTEDGSTGYVLKQYMTAEVPKQQIIARLQKQVAGLEAQLKDIGSDRSVQLQELQNLRSANQELEGRYAAAAKELDALKKSYQELRDSSQDLLGIMQERDRLQQQNQQLTAEATTLRDENQTLLVAAIVKWFLAGAGVLFFGWVMGKVSRKRARPF